MSAVRKPRSRERGWTDEQRQEQARRLRERQIWLKSTGPKTPEGKITSSRNARHADYDSRQVERAEMRNIKAYLRTQKTYTDLLNLFIKQEHRLNVAHHNELIDALFFLENKLSDIERLMFEGCTFYEIISRDHRQKQGNIIPFPPPSDRTT